MAEKFNKIESNKAAWRALQIWQILISLAYNWQNITYGQLAEMIEHNSPHTMNVLLEPIMRYCIQEDLPPLTVLVINNETGKPGAGIEWDTEKYPTENIARMAVFKRQWFHIIPPTAEELRNAVVNHR